MSTQIFKMVRNSIKYWYIPLIVGIILIGLGIYTFTSPQESYLALALLFSLSLWKGYIIILVNKRGLVLQTDL